jgi:hypothetical protein
MHTYTRAHAYIHTRTCIHTHAHMHTYTRTHAFIHTRTCIHTHAHMRTYTRAHEYIHRHTCVYTYEHMCTLACRKVSAMYARTCINYTEVHTQTHDHVARSIFCDFISCTCLHDELCIQNHETCTIMHTKNKAWITSTHTHTHTHVTNNKQVLFMPIRTPQAVHTHTHTHTQHRDSTYLGSSQLPEDTRLTGALSRDVGGTAVVSPFFAGSTVFAKSPWAVRACVHACVRACVHSCVRK